MHASSYRHTPVPASVWNHRHHLLVCPRSREAGAGTGPEPSFADRQRAARARAAGGLAGLQRTSAAIPPGGFPLFLEAGLWDGALEPLLHGFLRPEVSFASATALAVQTAALVGSERALLFAERPVRAEEPGAALMLCALGGDAWDPDRYGRFLARAGATGAAGAAAVWQDAGHLWLLDLSGHRYFPGRAHALVQRFAADEALTLGGSPVLHRVPVWSAVVVPLPGAAPVEIAPAPRLH